MAAPAGRHWGLPPATQGGGQTAQARETSTLAGETLSAAAAAAAAATGATAGVGSSASSSPLPSPDAPPPPHPLRAFMHRSREEVVAQFLGRSAGGTADSDGGVGGTKAALADALAAYVAAIPPGGRFPPPAAEDRPWRMKRRRLAATLTAIEKKELRALRNRERSMLLRTAAKRRLLALQAAAVGLVDDNVGLENMLAVLLAVDTGAKLRARQHIGRRGLAQLQYVLV